MGLVHRPIGNFQLAKWSFLWQTCSNSHENVRDNMDNFTAVTRDAIEYMVSIRGADMEIPDLSKELAQWATECKCLEAGVLIQLPGQLN